MARVRLAVALTSVFAGLTLVSACGDGQDGPQKGPISLDTRKLGNLGIVVTDGDGRTLYRFDRDTANPPASNCDDACTSTWPPLLAGADTTVKANGVDATLVRTVTRKDGTKQVTLNGWPLYRYAKDTAAGQARGQAKGSTWYAVTPLGRRAGTPANGPATAGNAAGVGIMWRSDSP